MSANRHRPHLVVLPEDDANRQMAVGFELEMRNHRPIDILEEAGGWSRVRDDFMAIHQNEMRKYPERRFLLLLDFDDDKNRRRKIEALIPDDLKDRVFLLGVRSEPEALTKAEADTFEKIGQRLAIECREGRWELWQHELLRDNAAELVRLNMQVRQILFG